MQLLHLYIRSSKVGGYGEMNASKSRIDALVITVGFLGIYLFYRMDWLLYVSFSIGILSVISEKWNGFVSAVWNSLTQLLGRIIPSMLLAVVYFLVLTPISFAYRLMAGDSMNLKEGKSSQFENVDKEFAPSDFEKTW